MNLNELSLTQAAAAVSAGEASAAEILGACTARIAAREPDIRAFEFFDPELAAAQLKTPHTHSGLLAGLPVGVKDIMDTADMPTGWGSPIYAGRRPERDAGCVRVLRRAGAVIAGKTVTTEFAYFNPGKTRNPHNPKHTPGGSSMGSAAAVADFMIPAALGTQTAASVIRPAAYCGVVGYKASRGAFDLSGVCALAQSLDSLGFFTRRAEDLALLRAAYLGAPPPPPENRPRRIGLVRTPHWDEASPETRALIESAAVKLSAHGGAAEDVEIGPSDGALTAAQNTVMAFEAARARAFEADMHPDKISAPFKALIETGRETPFEAYQAARALAREWRARLRALAEDFDFLLAPSAPGEAPKGLAATGDPLFSRMWTLLGAPCVTLPAGAGPEGLPLGVQLIGAPDSDDRLIRDAAWAEAHL